MGRQSGRIVKDVNNVLKDHKDIIGFYNGQWYHHDAIYHGSTLVWEKLSEVLKELPYPFGTFFGQYPEGIKGLTYDTDENQMFCEISNDLETIIEYQMTGEYDKYAGTPHFSNGMYLMEKSVEGMAYNHYWFYSRNGHEWTRIQVDYGGSMSFSPCYNPQHDSVFSINRNFNFVYELILTTGETKSYRVSPDVLAEHHFGETDTMLVIRGDANFGNEKYIFSASKYFITWDTYNDYHQLIYSSVLLDSGLFMTDDLQNIKSAVHIEGSEIFDTFSTYPLLNNARYTSNFLYVLYDRKIYRISNAGQLTVFNLATGATTTSFKKFYVYQDRYVVSIGTNQFIINDLDTVTRKTQSYTFKNSISNVTNPLFVERADGLYYIDAEFDGEERKNYAIEVKIEI